MLSYGNASYTMENLTSYFVVFIPSTGSWRMTSHPVVVKVSDDKQGFVKSLDLTKLV